MFVHPSSEVKTKKIGSETRIWQFCVIYQEANIGSECNICSHVLIENEVSIGDRVTIKSGVQLWDGVHIEDDVFIGPNVTFTNDLYPRSRSKDWNKINTIIKNGASIGANATILAGVQIGAYSLVGAGTVILKNVSANEIWVGNPARKIGFITNEGNILNLELKDKKTGQQFLFNKKKKLIRKE